MNSTCMKTSKIEKNQASDGSSSEQRCTCLFLSNIYNKFKALSHGANFLAASNIFLT